MAYSTHLRPYHTAHKRKSKATRKAIELESKKRICCGKMVLITKRNYRLQKVKRTTRYIAVFGTKKIPPLVNRG